MTASEVEQIVAELKSFQTNQGGIERKVNEIHQGLYGVPNTDDKGFCGDLKILKTDYNHFKKNVIIILSIFAGSGGLGAALMKMLGG